MQKYWKWLLIYAVIVLAVPGISAQADQENQALFDGYVSRLLAWEGGPVSRRAGLDSLSDTEKFLYAQFQTLAEDLAAGRATLARKTYTLEDFGAKTVWTGEDLGVEGSLLDGSRISEQARTKLREALAREVSYDTGHIMDLLLLNCPYELYWFDKTQGSHDSYNGGISYNGAQNALVVSQTYTFEFYVAQAYQDTGAGEDAPFTVKAGLTAAPMAAAAKAKSIVEKYAGSTDYEKLRGYLQEICTLASYNGEAANDLTTPFGNPWQLVWVFDGDPDTKVVCEGYAKAFQYLCDLTSFAGNVESSLVSGYMSGGTGAGPHMWNAVAMPDGKNYLVDVTNCDAGTVGEGELLFLKGFSSGSVEDGYWFRCNGANVGYAYDEKTTDIYGKAALTLSGTAYDPAFAPQSSFRSSLAADGSRTVTGYSGTGTDVVIPSELEGAPVRSVGADAFKGKNSIIRVTVPDSVKTIGSKAFADCGHLAMLIIRGDPEVAADAVPAGTVVFCGESTALHGWLAAKGYKTVALEKADRGLTVLRLPEDTAEIGQQAFIGSAADAVFIPAGVRSIGDGAFGNMKNLEFVVFEGNKTPRLEGSPFAGSDRAWQIGTASGTGLKVFTSTTWQGLFPDGE